MLDGRPAALDSLPVWCRCWRSRPGRTSPAAGRTSTRRQPPSGGCWHGGTIRGVQASGDDDDDFALPAMTCDDYIAGLRGRGAGRRSTVSAKRIGGRPVPARPRTATPAATGALRGAERRGGPHGRRGRRVRLRQVGCSSWDCLIRRTSPSPWSMAAPTSPRAPPPSREPAARRSPRRRREALDHRRVEQHWPIFVLNERASRSSSRT